VKLIFKLQIKTKKNYINYDKRFEKYHANRIGLQFGNTQKVNLDSKHKLG